MYGSKIVTMPLPDGRDWVFFPDLYLVALAPHLDQAGRDRALDELQAEWRATTVRGHLASVPTEPTTNPIARPLPAPVMVPVLNVPASAV